MHLVFAPVALVGLLVGPDKPAKALNLVLLEDALVNRAVGPDEFALPVLLTVFVVSL